MSAAERRRRLAIEFLDWMNGYYWQLVVGLMDFGHAGYILASILCIQNFQPE